MMNLPPECYCCAAIIAIIAVGCTVVAVCASMRGAQISEARRKAGLEE